MLVLAVLLPIATEAKSVVRSGERVSVAEDQQIDGNFYTAGTAVNHSGVVSGDLLAIAATLTMNGSVEDDAFIVAPAVDVHGTVGGDLRVIGGTVIIAEPVLGDVFIIGQSVEILSTASIAGDVVIFAGDVEINGTIEGNVLGQVDTLRIDSQITGSVDVTVNDFTIGDRANIVGTVEYTSQNQLVRAQNATLAGEVLRNDPVFEPAQVGIDSFVVPLLIILFSVALWYLLARRMLNRVVMRALSPSVRPIITGVVVLLLAPFAISMLLVSVLGLFAGAALLFAYLLFLILSVVAAAAVVGHLVLSTLKKGVNQVTLLTLAIGSALFSICFVVPVVGPILFLGFTVLTFGTLVDLLVRSGR